MFVKKDFEDFTLKLYIIDIGLKFSISVLSPLCYDRLLKYKNTSNIYCIQHKNSYSQDGSIIYRWILIILFRQTFLAIPFSKIFLL